MQRVDVPVPEPDAEMQVFSGYPACCPCYTYQFSRCYRFARGYQDMGEMAVNTLKFTVGNTDIVAKAGVKSGVTYPAVHNAENGIAAGGKINTHVERWLSGNRMNPLAE